MRRVQPSWPVVIRSGGSERRRDWPTIPVVMCLWRRPHLLERTLNQLLAQRSVHVELHLLNNNAAIRGRVDAIVARYRAHLCVDVVHGTNRLGCFGRFALARRIRGSFPFVVVIDDDQVFDEWFLRTLWDERARGGVCAAYARDWIGERYVDRCFPEPGEPAQYCGPGGMILDTRILDGPELMQCPERYYLVDDLWQSFVYGHVLRVPAFRASARVAMADRANDLWVHLYDRKDAVLQSLRREGWAV